MRCQFFFVWKTKAMNAEREKKMFAKRCYNVKKITRSIINMNDSLYNTRKNGHKYRYNEVFFKVYAIHLRNCSVNHSIRNANKYLNNYATVTTTSKLLFCMLSKVCSFMQKCNKKFICAGVCPCMRAYEFVYDHWVKCETSECILKHIWT